MAYHPKGYQQYSSLAAVKKLTDPPTVGSAMPTDGSVQFVIITAELQTIRWRDDGVAPTSAIGNPLAAGVPFEYDGDPAKLQFLEAAAGGKLNVSLYGI